jgi:nucleoside-diphosphate-sugar epimerase
MRIFVTGATGFIGSATVPELLGAGHQVVGLARSDASADALVAAGAEVQRGELDDLDSLRQGADRSEGVIHLGYIHDFTQYEAAAQTDQRAIQALGQALEGSGHPLVIASGTAGLPPGRVSTEGDVPDPDHPMRARQAGAEMALAFGERGVRSSVVRLAPTVHGPGDQGFMAMVIATARDQGVSGFVGDGANRWPAVHRLDAGTLFRLAVEEAPAGSVLHGVADEGVSLRAVAEVIGRHLDLPVVSIAPEDAFDHFGWLAALLGADIPASSQLTRQLLGWNPTHPGLLEDLDEGHYFEAVAD